MEEEEAVRLLCALYQPFVFLQPALGAFVARLGLGPADLLRRFLRPALRLRPHRRLRAIGEEGSGRGLACSCGRHIRVALGRQDFRDFDLRDGDAYFCLDTRPGLPSPQGPSRRLCLLLLVRRDSSWREVPLRRTLEARQASLLASAQRWLLWDGGSGELCALPKASPCQPSPLEPMEEQSLGAKAPALLDLASLPLGSAPKEMGLVRGELLERGLVSAPTELTEGPHRGRALLFLRPVQGIDFTPAQLAQLLSYVHYAHTRGGGEVGLVVVVAGGDAAFHDAVADALDRLKCAGGRGDALRTVFWATMTAQKMEGEVEEMERELGREAVEGLREPTSPRGEDYVAFRRQLDTVTRTCRFLGEGLLRLYRELQEPEALPARLWARPSGDLRALHAALRARLDELDASEAMRVWREESDDLLRSCANDFPDILQQPRCQNTVERAQGFQTYIGKVLGKAWAKASDRLELLERLTTAAEGREVWREARDWAEKELSPKLATLGSEVSVSIFRLRVQEREFEAFYQPSRERLGRAEEALVETEGLRRLEALSEAQREQLAEEWQATSDAVEAASASLEAVRTRIADSLVAHHMLEKLYDWALRNAKWASRIEQAAGASAGADQPGSSSQPFEDVDTARRSVHQQLAAYPSTELSQLPDYVQRLQDEKIRTQLESLTQRCEQARSVLLGHAERLGEPLKEADEVDALPGSPTSTVYEEPRGRRCQDDDFFSRRLSYAGTSSTKLFQSPPPTPREENDCPEGVFSPQSITTDLTAQVVRSMGDATLKKRLGDRKGSQWYVPGQSAETPLPSAPQAAAELERQRPGSARFANACRRPFARFLKRATTTSDFPPPPTSQAPPPPGVSHLARQRFSIPNLPVSLPPPLGASTAAASFPSVQSLVSESESASESSSSQTKSSQETETGSRVGSESGRPLEVSVEVPPPPAAFRLGSPPPFATPDHRIVHMIISELIDTEFAYVHSLHYVIQHYVPELLREDLPQELRGQRSTVFGNLEKIYRFHVCQFLPQLRARIEGADSEALCLEVGRVFLDAGRGRGADSWHLYALFNKNKPKSDALMSSVGAVFFRTKQLVLGDAMDLGSYLLKPVQRMGKYALLLAQLLKACPPDDQEALDVLRRAEEMLTFQLRHGNHLLAMDLIHGCHLNLSEQGQLLRQDQFLVAQRGSALLPRSKALRRVFLFENLVLLTKPQRSRGEDERFVAKEALRMWDVGLTESVGESTVEFELWVRRDKGSRQTFVLAAPSAEVRAAWVADVSRLLWRQANRNRETRLLQSSAMGVEEKSALSLHASLDPIEDRAVGPRPGPAQPRPSGLRAPGPRPHSLISHSSFSSASTQSSQPSQSLRSPPLPQLPDDPSVPVTV